MNYNALQIVAIAVSVVLTLTGVALLTRAASYIYRVVALGQPDPRRTSQPAARTVTCCASSSGTPGCRGCRSWHRALVHHGVVRPALPQPGDGVRQLFDPDFALVLLGHFPPTNGWSRGSRCSADRHPDPDRDPAEAAPARPGPGQPVLRIQLLAGLLRRVHIAGVLLCVAALRSLEYALDTEHRGALHYPLGQLIGSALTGLSTGTLKNTVVVVAAVKI